MAKIIVTDKLKLQLVFYPHWTFELLAVFININISILSFTCYHAHTNTKQVIWNIAINAYRATNHSYQVNNIYSILLCLIVKWKVLSSELTQEMIWIQNCILQNTPQFLLKYYVSRFQKAPDSKFYIHLLIF